MASTTTLPPVPDPVTGQPRPPHAPVRSTWPSGVPDVDPARRPNPPPGEGPVLEHFRESRREGLRGAAFMFGVAALISTWKFGGFGWVSVWYAWAFVIAPFVLHVLYTSWTDVFSAGALWLQYKSRWVRTYELTEIKLKGRGWGWVYLQVEDRHLQRLWVPMNLLVQNRELWDLVYNGILHSAHTNRVRTNRGARTLLRLPPDHPIPPAAGGSRDASDVSRPRAGVRRVAEMRAERRARGRR